METGHCLPVGFCWLQIKPPESSKNIYDMFIEITIIYLECKHMVTDEITGKYLNGLY